MGLQPSSATAHWSSEFAISSCKLRRPSQWGTSGLSATCQCRLRSHPKAYPWSYQNTARQAPAQSKDISHFQWSSFCRLDLRLTSRPGCRIVECWWLVRTDQAFQWAYSFWVAAWAIAARAIAACWASFGEGIGYDSWGGPCSALVMDYTSLVQYAGSLNNLMVVNSRFAYNSN